MVKLIRYANEGFKRHEYFKDDQYCPKLIRDDNRRENWILGCFVFVEEEDTDALISMNWDKRLYEKRNELIIPDDIMLWAENIFPIYNNGKIIIKPYISLSDKLLELNSWVKMSAKVIANRVKIVKEYNGICDWSWSQAIYIG